MWRIIYFSIFTVWILNMSCASKPTEMIGYEGKNISFLVEYLAIYEKHVKYISRLNGLFSKKLVETSQANRWVRDGRVAVFDNTTDHRLTVLISGLMMEDSGLYLFGVDVKLQMDPVSEIQITVRKGEAQRPTTPPRVLISSLHSSANITVQNRFNEQTQDSHLRFVAVVSLVCVGTFLCVCPFGVVKVLHRVAVGKLSVSYHARKISDQVVDEYVKMSPVVLPNSPSSRCDDRSVVNESDRSTDIDQHYTDVVPASDEDQIYTKINTDSFQVSV